MVNTPSPEAIDRLVDFLYSDLTQEEVKDELKELNIDVEPAVKRVQKMIADHKGTSNENH